MNKTSKQPETVPNHLIPGSDSIRERIDEYKTRRIRESIVVKSPGIRSEAVGIRAFYTGRIPFYPDPTKNPNSDKFVFHKGASVGPSTTGIRVIHSFALPSHLEFGFMSSIALKQIFYGN
jgi:hypothetical protein